MHPAPDSDGLPDARQRMPHESPRAGEGRALQTVKAMTQEVAQDVCDLCGAEVEAVVICPNGKEICRECFNAGQC